MFRMTLPIVRVLYGEGADIRKPERDPILFPLETARKPQTGAFNT